MAELRVPGPYKAALGALARMSEAQVSRLIEAFESVAGYRPVRELSEVVTETLGEETGTDAEELVTALLSLRGQYRTTSVERLARAASEAVVDEPDLRDQLRQRIEALIRLPSMSTTAGAVDVLTQHQFNYQSARILTDIRPVFPEDVEAPPTGAVIVEVLQIQSWQRDGSTHTFHVAMDQVDLNELKEVVDRALKKTGQVRDLLDKVGMERFELDKPDI